jgi:hypothetical protein
LNDLQALEKALKALLKTSSTEIQTTAVHDVCDLAALTGDTMLRDRACQLQSIIGVTSRLQYPDTLPSPAVPRDAYTLDDAVTAYDLTRATLCRIRRKLRIVSGSEL